MISLMNMMSQLVTAKKETHNKEKLIKEINDKISFDKFVKFFCGDLSLIGVVTLYFRLKVM